MKKAVIATLLLVVMAPALLWAQAPKMRMTMSLEDRVQHRVEMLTDVLSLTATQQQQATTIFTNAENAETAVHQSMKTAHQSLQGAIQANDTATIDQIAATIGSLTAQISATDAKANAALYQVLTPDQQAKFNKMEGGARVFFFAGAPGPMMLRHGAPPE